MMLAVWRPAAPPVTDVGCANGSATNGIRLAVFRLAVIVVKSTPVFPYWFDSQTYGVRPVNRPTPPRSCDRVADPPLRSQLKPARGDHIFGAVTISVRNPKSVTVRGFECGVSGNCGMSSRTP